MAESAPPVMRILLIDDDPDHIIIIRRAIRDLEPDNEIVNFENGTEAIDWVRTQETMPDLILLDINMPGLTGFEVLETMKNDDRLKTVPVVMLTSSALSADVARAYELGASGFISKPSYLNDLKAVLGNTMLYWSAMKQANREAR